MLEVMAVNELVRRRQKLEQYQVQARFAMAENYDRASKAKSQEETTRLDAEQKNSAAKVPTTKQPAVQPVPAKTPGTQ